MTSSNTTSTVNTTLVYRYFAHTGGWRFVVLFHNGRKWIKVLETARLDVHTLRITDADKLRPCADIAPKRLARRLRSRRAKFRRLELHFPKRAVARAIAVLEAS